MASPFLTRLQAGTLVVDGATGTNLQARGLTRGTPSDVWLIENPAEVMRLHRDFINAGSNLILTDTFGCTRTRLAHVGLQERVVEMNQKAVELARAAAQGTDVMVGGSIGPTGQILEPLGPLSEADAKAAFTEQAQALIEAGVDLLVIETQFDLSEARAAFQAVRALTADLPVVVSFSYDRGTRSMMGVKPTQVAREFSEAGASLLGINCGRSLEDNLKALQELRQATGLPIWFKPNAGLPRTTEDGGVIYDVTPEMMGAQVPAWLENGARVVGGCCGTSPEHLHQIALAARQAEVKG